jgi:hypothetical protein
MPKQEAKSQSSEKEKEDSLSVSASIPASMSNLVSSITNTEDEISKHSKDEEDKEIVKKKANELGDVVIALEVPKNCKRGRDISAEGEGLSTQPRKKTAREVKSKDSSEKAVRPSKKHLNESTPKSKSTDLSEGSLLRKSKGLNEKSATLSREVMQVNMKDKKDDDLPDKGPTANDENTGRIRGKTLFKKGPEATTEALSRKVSNTNTPHKTKIAVKPQGSSENGTDEENINVPKEISRRNDVPLEEKVQEPKMRGLSERRREMEGGAKKKLSSSGPAVKKHQLGAEETPPALKGSKLFDRSVPSGEIFRVETKLDAHAGENSDRKRGSVKRSCLFNEGEESEGKRTPVHRKASVKLENQKKATISPQLVKMPEKRVEKFELREHGNMHVNIERRTGHTVKSTQERIRDKTKPTTEKDSFLADR